MKNLAKYLSTATAVLMLVLPVFAKAEIFKFEFTSSPQTVKTNSISEAMTIQAQDLDGMANQTQETIDLEFLSTSGTGEFLGSSGNPATKTMSVNTANRTFYYRDSSEGNFTITVNATGRTSGQKWTANQAIVVTDGGAENNSISQSSGGGSSASNSSSQTGSSSTKATSPNSAIELYPLNDRQTTVGSPIEFQAAVKKSTSVGKMEFNWSFGDGNVGIGQIARHTYKFVGDYAVVLNVRSGDTFSVTRFKVKVTAPQISLANEADFIEISNDGNYEINLFNWKIESEGKGFIFQPDTIVMPHMKLRLEKRLLSMKGTDNGVDTSLKNSLGEVVASLPSRELIKLGEAAMRLEAAKNQLIAIKPVSQDSVKALSTSTNKIEDKIEILSDATSSQSHVLYEAPKNPSFISKLTNLIKRVFSK